MMVIHCFTDGTQGVAIRKSPDRNLQFRAEAAVVSDRS
jgi:hypothetical protein